MFIRRAAIKALSPHCIHEGLNARVALRRNQFPRTRGKHSGGHKIIHRLFSFHLADYRGDRLSRDRFSRQVPLFSSSPSFWIGRPVSSTMRETRGFRNYYAVDAQRRRFRLRSVSFTIYTRVCVIHISLYIYPIFIYTHTNSLRAKRHAPARVRMYRSSFKPRCKPRRLARDILVQRRISSFA